MKLCKRIGLWYFSAMFLSAYSASAAPADESAWLTCQNDTQCSSVELGCWYWQPVNSRYADAMKAKYPSSCLQSATSVSQPVSHCMHNLCGNSPYVVRDWQKFDITQKAALVGNQIQACLNPASPQTDWITNKVFYAQFSDPFLEKANALISKGAFDDNKPLQEVIESVVPCEDVNAAARLFY